MATLKKKAMLMIHLRPKISIINDADNDFDDKRLTSLPGVGDTVKLYRLLDDKLYNSIVMSLSDDDQKNKIDYDNGVKKNLSNEVWRYSSDNPVAASSVQIAEKVIVSSERHVLVAYVRLFGQKCFIKFQA